MQYRKHRKIKNKNIMWEQKSWSCHTANKDSELNLSFDAEIIFHLKQVGEKL